MAVWRYSKRKIRGRLFQSVLEQKTKRCRLVKGYTYRRSGWVLKNSIIVDKTYSMDAIFDEKIETFKYNNALHYINWNN